MDVNKNSSNCNGEQSLEPEINANRKQRSIEEREAFNLKQRQRRASLCEEDREKRRQKDRERRANLSEEDREKRRQKDRERRANLSDEDREKLKQRDRERRSNLSDEDRAIVKKKNSVQHRNKYQEDKSFMQQHRQMLPTDDDDEVYDENVHHEDNEATIRMKALLLNRDKKYVQNRTYKKARYAQLREAEEKLKAVSTEGTNGGGDVDIQQLQLLANRRQQILEYARAYRQTHPQHNHRWVQVTQVWDEDSPCR